VSAGFVAFTHGTNDAQKTMGIICLALIVTGQLSADDFEVPLWVIVSAATAMAAGTYAGGWPIINTLGRRITKLEPVHGFGAETATASILWTTGQVGFPVSTTHTISGSVLGAGASRRFSAVRWGIAGNIFVAWLFTIPCAALVGAGMEGISRAPGGEAVVFAAAIAVSVLAFRARAIQLRAAEAAQPAPAAAGGGA
jgi:PiT family inorganic phosphate transporter